MKYKIKQNFSKIRGKKLDSNMFVDMTKQGRGGLNQQLPKPDGATENTVVKGRDRKNSEIKRQISWRLQHAWVKANNIPCHRQWLQTEFVHRRWPEPVSERPEHHNWLAASPLHRRHLRAVLDGYDPTPRFGHYHRTSAPSRQESCAIHRPSASSINQSTKFVQRPLQNMDGEA